MDDGAMMTLCLAHIFLCLERVRYEFYKEAQGYYERNHIPLLRNCLARRGLFIPTESSLVRVGRTQGPAMPHLPQGYLPIGVAILKGPLVLLSA